jgi:uncharacterized damage-inducible protein DinB
VSDFEQHLSEVTANLDRARGELLAVLSDLKDEDLDRARRGGWTVGKVLGHIIGSEWHYAQLAASLRGKEASPPPPQQGGGVSLMAKALSGSRDALLASVHGVSEDDFYRLGHVGREEYSIVSVLENVEQHDIEHLGQIKSIRASTQ